jgi:hypothetical protein
MKPTQKTYHIGFLIGIIYATIINNIIDAEGPLTLKIIDITMLIIILTMINILINVKTKT